MKRARVDSEYDPNNVNYVAESKIESEIISFIWTLKGISSLDPNKTVRSPLIGDKNHSWRLDVTPINSSYDESNNSDREGAWDVWGSEFQAASNYNETNQAKHLCIYLQYDGSSKRNDKKRSASQEARVMAKFEIALLNADNKPQEQHGSLSNYCDFGTKSSYGWAKFVAMDKLLKSCSGLVVDDAIKIHCRIEIKGEQKDAVYPNERLTLQGKAAKVRSNLRLKKLKRDLSIGLNSSTNSDVTLVTKTKTFQAHRFMLVARSRVFHAMFTSPMQESLNNTVDIPDFDEDVVRLMLDYIYSSEVSLDSKAGDLYLIADKYELMDLKEECEVVLGYNLKIENACETLLLAHTGNSPQLKKAVLSFINRHKYEVSKTEAFKELELNPSLVMELYLSQK